jgi:hypothetical protein
LESIDLVETAKYCAENPTSPHTDFLMRGAESMCNSQAPTNMAQMLGLEPGALDALAPHQWFQNPCGPALYEDKRNNGPSEAHSLSPDSNTRGESESSEEDEDDRRMSF